MTIEEGLVAFLLAQSGITTLIGTRIMPAPLRQNVQLPAISYQLISVRDDVLHDGPQGLPDTRIQLDCWADTYAGAKTLAATVKTAVHGYKGTMGTVSVQRAKVENVVDGFEPNTGRQRVIMDVLLMYQE
jgi:hypothetical protein